MNFFKVASHLRELFSVCFVFGDHTRERIPLFYGRYANFFPYVTLVEYRIYDAFHYSIFSYVTSVYYNRG